MGQFVEVAHLFFSVLVAAVVLAAEVEEDERQAEDETT